MGRRPDVRARVTIDQHPVLQKHLELRYVSRLAVAGSGPEKGVVGCPWQTEIAVCPGVEKYDATCAVAPVKIVPKLQRHDAEPRCVRLRSGGRTLVASVVAECRPAKIAGLDVVHSGGAAPRFETGPAELDQLVACLFAFHLCFSFSCRGQDPEKSAGATAEYEAYTALIVRLFAARVRRDILQRRSYAQEPAQHIGGLGTRLGK